MSVDAPVSAESLFNELHKERRFRPRYPEDELVRWTFRNLHPHSTPPEKVLDLGTGAGRHAFFLAGEGFETYACDFSRSGIAELQKEATRRSLEIKAEVCDASRLSPYPDAFFDGIVCNGVLYYMHMEAMEKAVAEILRVLKPGGKLYCLLRTPEDSRLKQATPVAPHMWRLENLDPSAPSQVEAGLVLYFPTEPEIRRLFQNFATLTLGRRTVTLDGFSNDDWLVSAAKA